jgi:phosphoenolpyruvate synthase/pyruvate phosphate dikinase
MGHDDAQKYEKHQRDYTVLGTSVAFESIFSKKVYDFFPFKPRPMYILVSECILYHFVSKADYNNWGRTWLRNNSLSDLIKYDKKMSAELLRYRKFLQQDHANLEDSLKKAEEYIKIFMPIVLIAAYVLPYAQNKISRAFEGKLLEIRKKYDDVHKSNMTLQVKLLSQLEKRYNLAKGTLNYITNKELKVFLTRKRLPLNVTSKSKFLFIKFSISGKEKIFPKSQAEKILLRIQNRFDGGEMIKNIKGAVAYSGLVTGRVRIIHLIKDINKLKTGEILVTSMTDPRYLTAMKKAAGFITDEGGITCHAAIVARELNKPCIIGTRIATQSLHDGDLIEINAYKGIIKILKRA